MTTETVFPHEVVAEQDRFVAAQRILEEAIAARAFPGCAFGARASGKVVLQGALGRFIYDESSPAVAADTVFDIASLTKVACTTAVAMLLHQRGRLDLDTPVADLLPGFIVGRESASQALSVTLRHLLAHTSGLPGYVEFFRTHTTPAGLFRACLELPIEAAPGTRAEYSDPGFVLLGKALEVILGEHLPTWAHREIYEPLGMSASFFNPRPSARAAIPPTQENDALRHRLIQGEVQDENAAVLNGCAGHAGLFSNVGDLLRFAQEILAAAHPDFAATPARLFTADTVNLFAERQPPVGSSRALGWDTPSVNSSSGHHFSSRSIGHLGYSGCSLWIDLKDNVAIVLLANRTWPDRSTPLIKEVRPAFHDAVREAL